VGGLLASTLVTLVIIPVTYITASGGLALARQPGRWRWERLTVRGGAPAGGRPVAEG
jgi:hypothetical protein